MNRLQYTHIAPAVLSLLAAVMLAACGQGQNTEKNTGKGLEHEESIESEESEKEISESVLAEADASEPPQTDEMKKRFGENCISEQTFEVELSEYNGKVYFVPYAPSKDNEEFGMQIIQDDEVLADIKAYVPNGLLYAAKFSSLDAVSFYDVNFDDCTDIVLIETNGNKSFAAVYYGFDVDARDYERYFFSEDRLSEELSRRVEPLTISGIRDFLTDGKRNGEFGGYQEAYDAVSRLYALKNESETEYGLIYFDADDIPELIVGRYGYWTSMYTYHDGKVYTLMDHWAYGAMGNAGYEYIPRGNRMRNYNADCAGLILNTTYMAVSDRYSLETVTCIETLNFEDVNGDGIPNESEMESAGEYGVSYVDGVEVTEEELGVYLADEDRYEFIRGYMSLEELNAALQNCQAP